MGKIPPLDCFDRALNQPLEVRMTTSVIVAGARTPIGKLMGALKDLSGTDLGAIAIKAALEKANVGASLVEYVIMGQVLTAGAGQMPARQ
jgi:acetyl-CoA C-acetyltransferase